jgi:hypothetical protein
LAFNLSFKSFHKPTSVSADSTRDQKSETIDQAASS